jgi:hypothetical protein
MRDTRVPDSACPYCHAVLNMAGSFGLDSPSPRDLTICIHCKNILKFTQGLALASVSEEELKQAEEQCPSAYAELIQIVELLRGGA